MVVPWGGGGWHSSHNWSDLNMHEQPAISARAIEASAARRVCKLGGAPLEGQVRRQAPEAFRILH